VFFCGSCKCISIMRYMRWAIPSITPWDMRSHPRFRSLISPESRA
jgi:hypothetical protein